MLFSCVERDNEYEADKSLSKEKKNRVESEDSSIIKHFNSYRLNNIVVKDTGWIINRVEALFRKSTKKNLSEFLNLENYWKFKGQSPLKSVGVLYYPGLHISKWNIKDVNEEEFVQILDEVRVNPAFRKPPQRFIVIEDYFYHFRINAEIHRNQLDSIVEDLERKIK